MKRACVIAAYFGELPELFHGWLISVKHNTEFDFFLVTDQRLDGDILPSNLKVVNMNLSDMRTLAASKLEMKELVLNTPYKCCDYKPVYGIIFEDYVKEYEFVGNCDLDMIFGDLSSYITDEIWNNYDKILPLGHLAFYRNTKEVLEHYKLDANVFADYKKAFTVEQMCVFDEEAGINNIYRDNNLRLYDKYIMADISEKNTRMKLTSMSLNKNKEYVNYNYQVFYYEDGRILRSYIDENGNVGQDEFAYLHAKRRKINADVIKNNYEKAEGFYILSDRIELKGDITKEKIIEYSGFISTRYDKLEVIKYKIYDLFRKGKRRCKRVMRRL